MPQAFPIRGAWQFDTPGRRLALALAISLLVHALLYTSWRISPAVARFTHAIAQRVLPQSLRPKPALAQTPKPPPNPAPVPMVFVEVDPALASAEPPRETKYYSTHNTIAANPDPAKSDVPKLDGREKRVMRLADNPKPKPQPLQPTPPKPEPETKPNEEPEAKPKPAPQIGDLAMAKTEPKVIETPRVDSAKLEDKPRPKPRTLREAAQRNPSLAGQRTLQEGGVQQRGHIAMVDAKGSPFGDYDYAFIRAVEARWNNLLDNNQYLLDRQGQVSLTFRLHYDGRISDMNVESNNVGDLLALLCQKAILDPAPFPRWPAPMRQVIAADYRDVKFTFYYD